MRNGRNLAILLLLAGGLSAGAQFVISEFMACKSSGLRDEDGDLSDWIEIWNTNAAPANLQNWFLTDTSVYLPLWRFPATNLAANARLLGFASGKNRLLPRASLHTSFRRTQPAATSHWSNRTVPPQPPPTSYPRQFPGISYGTGVAASSSADWLITNGAAARYRIPTAALSNWTATNYSESANWKTGALPAGYDASTPDPPGGVIRRGADGEPDGVFEESAIRRRMLSAANDIARLAYKEDSTIEMVMDGAEKAVFGVSERRMTRDLQTIQQVLSDYYDRIDQCANRGEEYYGVPTGFIDLDRLLMGLQPSDFILIAGRPGMGKTAFMLSAAKNAAQTHKKHVAVFSLEMSNKQLVQRLIAAETGIDSQRLRTGKLEEDDWPKFTHAVEVLSDTRIFLDDTPALTPLQLRTKCRRLHLEYNLDLILVHRGPGPPSEWDLAPKVAPATTSTVV